MGTESASPSIGARIKTVRRAAGLSQEELAEAIWVSRNTVSNWETDATLPDAQSLVLLSALFGISIDDMLKSDARVMAEAIARDKSHLLLLGRGNHPADGTELDVAIPQAEGSAGRATFGRIDAVAEHGGYRLERVAAFFTRALYLLRDGSGRRVGTIAQRHTLNSPLFTIRVSGYAAVTVKRDSRLLPDGWTDLYRVDGEDIEIEGNVLGASFSLLRRGQPMARIAARDIGGQAVYGIELPDGDTRDLAIAVTMTFLFLRSHDAHFVRDGDEEAQV